MEHIKITDLGQNIKQVSLDLAGKPVNVFGTPLVTDLNAALEVLEGEPELAGVIFTSAKKDFVVGADIDEIEAIQSVHEATKASEALQAVFNRVEALPCPTVATLHGQCFGGGLEFALACSYRIATDDGRTSFSFPEVMLGLLPGAGGTQRTPKLIGIQTALDMMMTGRKVRAKAALRSGLIDDIVPKAFLVETAIRKLIDDSSGDDSIAQKLSSELPKWATDGNSLGRKIMANKAREMLDKKSKGHFPAPYKILDAVFDNYDKPLLEGLRDEAAQFGRLSQTRECKSLMHVFHCVTDAKKLEPKLSGPVSDFDGKSALVGVVGGGLMGGGIAQICAQKGIYSRVADPSVDSLGRMLGRLNKALYKKVEKRRMTEREARQTLMRVSPATSRSGLGQCDVVIEAVFEDIGLKRDIIGDLLSRGKEDQVVATNTSALPIEKIKEGLPHRERVLGMHFFSPVEKMPLLEIIRSEDTPDWVLERAFKLGTAMGKNIIVVNDGPGFYTTRILAFFLGEAVAILEEGAAVETIDSSLMDFGFPIGPISLIDEVGIDVGGHVLETISAAFPGRIATVDGGDLMADSERLGKKTGKGFYKYLGGKRLQPDREFIATMVEKAAKRDGRSRTLHSHDIIDRCMLLFVNEAFHCLQDGIIDSAEDGDLGAIFGLGFPAFWGGPFKYVDHMGAATIVDRMHALAEKYGERFTPCSLLKDHAESGKPIFT